jgi:holo-[acyl-carrier protein] synthase
LSVSVISVGIDIVAVSRVERLLARHGDRALRRLFTAGEREFVRTHAAPALHLAARLAAKEAAYKALSGDENARGIGWKDLEVGRRTDGRPVLRFHGRAATRFTALGATSSHLSLTHSGGVAAAVVVLD